MEQLFIAVIALVIVGVVRRKEILSFRWQPNRHTWAAVGVGLLTFALSASLLAVGPTSLVGRLIHCGLIYVGCGFVLPWGYTLLVERNGPSAMGLRRECWLLSLVISLVLALLLSPIILLQADLTVIDWGQFARAAVALVGAGGLFELFLYYGFIHLRLEKAFGPLPAILITSLLYVSWHVGTQLPLEPDIGAAVLKLLAVGIFYQSVFSLTRNLLIIWPLFLGVGVMIDYAVNLDNLAGPSARFPWALFSMALMAAAALLLAWAVRRRPRMPATGTASRA